MLRKIAFPVFIITIIILSGCSNTGTGNPTSTPETATSTPTPTATASPSSTGSTSQHTFHTGTTSITVNIPQDWVVDEKIVSLETDIEIYDSSSKANVTITALEAEERPLEYFVDLYKDTLNQWGQESNVGVSIVSETQTEVDGNAAVSLVCLAPEFYNGTTLKHLAVMFKEKTFYLIECSTGPDLYDGFYEQFSKIIESIKVEETKS